LSLDPNAIGTVPAAPVLDTPGDRDAVRTAPTWAVRTPTSCRLGAHFKHATGSFRVVRRLGRPRAPVPPCCEPPEAGSGPTQTNIGLRRAALEGAPVADAGNIGRSARRTWPAQPRRSSRRSERRRDRTAPPRSPAGSAPACRRTGRQACSRWRGRTADVPRSIFR
jgi:hypothetical protein